MPQFTNAADEANDAAVRSQLQTLRGQIELYYAQNGSYPDLLTDWSEMIDGDYLMAAPVNSLTNSSSCAATPAAGVGWVWAQKSGPSTAMVLTGVAADGTAFSE